MKSTSIFELSPPAVRRHALAWLGMALFAACAPALAGDLVPSKDCAAGKCAQLRIDENFQVSRQILAGVPVEQAEWPAPVAPVQFAPATPATPVSGGAGANPWLVAALALGAGMLIQFLLQAAATRRRKPVAIPVSRPVSPAAKASVERAIATLTPPAPAAEVPAPGPVPEMVVEAALPEPVEIGASTEPAVAEAMPEAPAAELVVGPQEVLNLEAAVAIETIQVPVVESASVPPIEIAWAPDPAEVAITAATEIAMEVAVSPEAIVVAPVVEEIPAAVELPAEAAPVEDEAPVACEATPDSPVETAAVEPVEISAPVPETTEAVTNDAGRAPALAEMPAAEPEATQIEVPAQGTPEPEHEPEPILLTDTPEPAAEVPAAPAPVAAQPEAARPAPTPRDEQTVALLRRLAIQRSRMAPDERHASVFKLITQGQFVRAERVLLELEQPPEEEVIPSWSVTTAEHIALRRERELQNKLDGLRSRVTSEPGKRRLAVADAHLRRSRLDEVAEALEELEDEVLVA